jgi:pyruvate/2-oxoglutarate dehydrogenase complex dihydrolipoamide dehydrogenase (E3) component
VVIRNALFRAGAKVEHEAIPRTLYTDPPVAVVGLAEDEARAKDRGIRTLRWPFSENDRARAECLTDGEVKLICTRKGRILGAAIVGPHAGELIVPWALAIRKGLAISDFRDLVIPYPTFSEAAKRAAVGFYAAETRRPAVGRLLRFLRLFG